ncbi:hypothetical protein SD960_08075 [Flavobacterium sp. MMLR14_040]|uniref:hypothetical protein n=1 Tax=Flavobacterium sp. MMLR14_040 TaxID=3093843 RepID=UPI00299035C6|nr:hypothetical protein [Flavobacterium sp. MMLR14_040]MDW8850044.1 hypothetical protein [Flavobacterium sp. MMLR14_040]
MKKIILLSLLVYNMAGCQENKKSYNKINKEENKMMSATQPIYAIKVHSIGLFEIYVNGISIYSYKDKEASIVTLPINSNILASGAQTVQIILQSEDKLTKNELQNYSFKIVQYNGFDSPDVKVVEECTFNESLSKDKYTHTQSWTFRAMVPYNVTGWTNSVDLKKQNNDELLNEVQQFYQKTWNIINSGNYAEYYKIINKRHQENLIAFYNSPEVNEEQDEIKQRVLDAKSKMHPIDFSKLHLKIYSDGHLATLEDKDGFSPLSYETDQYTDYFGFILYRTKPDAPLEVIR